MSPALSKELLDIQANQCRFTLKFVRDIIVTYNLAQCLLTYWIVFVTVCLRSYFLIIDILLILNFFQCLYTFLTKNSKILIRSMFFLSISASKLSYILFPIKHFYLLTAKISSDVSNSLLLVHPAQELYNSRHVKRNFQCLIMTSTKLRQHVFVRSLIL